MCKLTLCRQTRKENLEGLTSLEKMAKHHQNLQELIDKTYETIDNIDIKFDSEIRDIQEIKKALRKWSSGLANDKERTEKSRKKEEPERRRKDPNNWPFLMFVAEY